MTQKDIEALHEQASSHYLEGNLEAAAATWSRLLEENPDDERAKDGLDLCQRMSGCETESVVTEGLSPFAVGEPAEVREPPDVATTPEPAASDDPLDRLLDLGPSIPQTPPKPTEGASKSLDDHAGELDFSDLRDECDQSSDREFTFESIFGEAKAPTDPPAKPAQSSEPPTAPAAPQPEMEWQFGQLPTPEPEAVAPEPEPQPDAVESPPAGEPPPEPCAEAKTDPGGASDESETPDGEVGADSAAAATLHRRASDLLSTALDEMEQGKKQAALQTLEHLLILDEHNLAARSLTQKLRAEIESGDAAAAQPTAGAPDETGGKELEPGGGEELNLDLEELPAEAPTPEPTPVEAETVLEPPKDDLTAGDSVTSAAPSGRRRIALPAARIWIPLAAVLVLGAGYLGWNLFLSGGGAADPNDVPTRAERPRKNQEPAEAGAVQASGEAGGGAAAEAPPKTLEQQVAEAVDRAEAALATADYAAAVIAFNEALALDPDREELLARLDAAGASFRIQKEKKERWDQAIDDFDHGDFEAALAYFYRLPTEEQTEQVQGYKLTGWYNLGVTALKKQNCDEALSNLREARELAPDDPAIDEALHLARRCSREGGSEVRAAISGLEFRGIQDAP